MDNFGEKRRGLKEKRQSFVSPGLSSLSRCAQFPPGLSGGHKLKNKVEKAFWLTCDGRSQKTAVTRLSDPTSYHLKQPSNSGVYCISQTSYYDVSTDGVCQ